MTRRPAAPPPRETRPCVVCRAAIEAGAAYVVTAAGPVHARHTPDRREPALRLVPDHQ
jgi:hypothetical protein